jgi:hypothetical protein
MLCSNYSICQSESHNLKYMGIDALGRLIRINPDIAEEHQLAVIDCLEVCSELPIIPCLFFFQHRLLYDILVCKA